MQVIRVDPPVLLQAAREIGRVARELRSEAGAVQQSLASAPSYDGQFGPQVAAIGAEAAVRAGALADRLEADSAYLATKAEAFQTVDAFIQQGLGSVWQQLQAWLQTDHAQQALSVPLALAQLQMLTLVSQPPPKPEPSWWDSFVFGLANIWNWYHTNVNEPIYRSIDTWAGIADNTGRIAVYGAAKTWFWYDENVNQRIYDSLEIWKGISVNGALIAQHAAAQAWFWYDRNVNQRIYDTVDTWRANAAMWDVIWNQKLHAVQTPGLPAGGPLTAALLAVSARDGSGLPVSPVGAELVQLIDARGGVNVTFADALTAGGTAGVAPWKGQVWLPNSFADAAVQGQPSGASLVSHELEHILQRDLPEFPDGYDPAGTWPYSTRGFTPLSFEFGAPAGDFTLYMESLSNIVQGSIHHDLLAQQLAQWPAGSAQWVAIDNEMQSAADRLATYTGDPVDAACFVVQDHGGYGMYASELVREIINGPRIPPGGWEHWLQQEGFSAAATQHIQDIANTGNPVPITYNCMLSNQQFPAPTATPTLTPTPTVTPIPTITPSATPTPLPSATPTATGTP